MKRSEPYLTPECRIVSMLGDPVLTPVNIGSPSAIEGTHELDYTQADDDDSPWYDCDF